MFDEAIKEFTDYELMRILLTRLWRLYDVYGVSMQRSQRSVFLETALILLPQISSGKYSIAENFSLQGLEEEAKTRMPASKQLVLFSTRQIPLELLPSPWIAYQMLYYLKRWYEEDRKHERPLYHEDSIAQIIFELVPDELKAPYYCIKKLCIEEKDRRFKKFELDIYHDEIVFD